MIEKYLRVRPIQYAILAFLIPLFYGTTLKNGFVHDDAWLIQNNTYITNIGYVFGAFKGCIAVGLFGACQKGNFYRPLENVSFALIRQLSDSPFVFHFANLLYSFILAITLLEFFKLLFKNPTSPFLATVLFISFPINSEVFNWVSAEPELLYSIFSLCSLIFYIRFSQKKKAAYLFFSVASFTLALFSKEAGIMTIILIALWEFLFGRPNKMNPLKRFAPLIMYAVSATFYLIVRRIMLGPTAYNAKGFYDLSIPSQIANGIVLYPQYLWEVIYPFPLNLMHRFTPVAFSDWEFWVSLFTIIINLCLFYFLYHKRYNTLLFGSIFFVAYLLPVLIFIDKLGQYVLAERYVFLSTAGFIIIVVSLIETGFKKWQGKTVKLVGFCLLGAYLFCNWWIIIHRNPDWQSFVKSFQATLRADPQNAQIHYQLGLLYKNQKKYDLASYEFSQASKLNPELSQNIAAVKPLANTLYKSSLGISFAVPKNWRVEEQNQNIQLKSQTSQSEIDISLESLQPSQTVDQYLLNKKERSGQITNQGPAQIPNFDRAYVIFWNDNGVSKYEFFLFRNTKIVKLLVFPVNNALLKIFDSVIESFKL